MPAAAGSLADALALLDGPAVLDRLAADLAALLAVPSITGSVAESRLQHEVAERLQGLGMTVDAWAIDLADVTAAPGFPGMEAPREEARGLVGEWTGPSGAADSAGTPATLMLNAHVDVVPPGDLAAWSSPPFTPRRDAGPDGRDSVFGRGANDMKGGLVAALAALEAARNARLPVPGRVLLASVVGEEDGGLGTFATLRRGHTADLAVVPEPTSCQVVCATGGALTFRLTVRGRATHGSSRRAGVSALEKLWPLLRALDDLEAEQNAETPPLFSHLDPPFPISVGTVTAGDWPSSVPAALVAEGRLGVPVGMSVDTARARLRSAVAAACGADPWLAEHPAHLEFVGGQFAPGSTDPGEPVVQRTMAAHHRLTGAAPLLRGAPYGSDLRLLAAAGIPTVHYGPGDVRYAHGPDEHVPLEEVRTTAKVLLYHIAGLGGADRPS